ncbi:insulinase family protein, partial [Candidatus Parcubacteria bacterium]|nr:insulinase family protein [Candidatus Parcubacteria bacterium]
MYSYSHFKKTLPSGLRFVVVDIPCLHRVVTTMFIKAGSAYESGGTNGLSHFLEHILLRGPEQYPNSIEFWQALESSGLSLGARAFKEFTYFSLDSISSALPKAIETLFQFLLSPRFNKDEVESERQITLEEALESLNAQGINVDVDDIASKLLWPNHPLGMTILGPAQNIKKFKIRDLK